MHRQQNKNPLKIVEPVDSVRFGDVDGIPSMLMNLLCDRIIQNKK